MPAQRRQHPGTEVGERGAAAGLTNGRKKAEAARKPPDRSPPDFHQFSPLHWHSGLLSPRAVRIRPRTPFGLAGPGRRAYGIGVQSIPLRQIFYHSRAIGRVDVSSIMASSKRNNGMDGITGLLLFDGRTFLQVLEGPEDSVTAAFDRITRDPRHSDVTVISDHAVSERDFAYWSMELRDPTQPSDDALWRLRRRLEHFDRDLQHYFFDEPTA